jgi:hypothetical protein
LLAQTLAVLPIVGALIGDLGLAIGEISLSRTRCCTAPVCGVPNALFACEMIGVRLPIGALISGDMVAPLLRLSLTALTTVRLSPAAPAAHYAEGV